MWGGVRYHKLRAVKAQHRVLLNVPERATEGCALFQAMGSDEKMQAQVPIARRQTPNSGSSDCKTIFLAYTGKAHRA